DPLKRVFTEQDEFFADTAVLFTMTYKYCKFSVQHIDLSNSFRQRVPLHQLLLDQSGGMSQIFIQSLVDEQIEYFLDFKTIVDEISELSCKSVRLVISAIESDPRYEQQYFCLPVHILHRRNEHYCNGKNDSSRDGG